METEDNAFPLTANAWGFQMQQIQEQANALESKNILFKTNA